MLKWIVVVLLVVVAGVVALTVTSVSTRSGLEGGIGVTGPSSDRSSATDLATAGAGGLERDRAGASPAGRKVLPSDYAAASSGTGSSQSLVVEALHPNTQQPLEDLDVWVLDRHSRPATEWQPAFRMEAERLVYLREHGQRSTTDGNGQVVVPRVASGAVLAEGEGFLGELSWTGPVEGPLQIKMRPVVDLVARVVDDAGHLRAGVPVAVVEDRGKERVMMVKVTSANGEASFTYLRKALGSRLGGAGYALTLHFPQANPVRVPLNPDALPSEAVELRMPPAAPMEVQVRGADGALIDGNLAIALGRKTDPLSRGREGFSVMVQQQARAGRTRFPWIEVGAQFELLLSGSGTLADQIVQVSGPPVPNDVYRLELVWDAQHPTIVGRAIGPDGEPLAGRRGTLELVQDRRRLSSSAFLCDADGRFSISIESGWKPGSQRLAGIHVGQSAEEGPVDAEVDLSFEVPPGPTDLGDVHFIGQPLLGAGQVVDDQGEPVTSAHLVAQYRKSGLAGDAWVNIDEASDTTNDQGQFRVYGNSPSNRVALRVRRRGLERGFLEFQAGESNLLIRMTAGAGSEEGADEGK